MIHTIVLAVGFGLVTASVLAIVGVGITLQYGVTNYINFALGSYVTLAAYMTWLFNTWAKLNFWLAIIPGAVFMGLFAVAVNSFVLQRFVRRNPPRIFLLIVTLGIWLVVSSVIVVIWGPATRQFNVGGEFPLNIGPFIFTPNQLLILALAVVVLSLVHVLLVRTKLGKAMRAMSDDPALAQVSGIDTERIATATWFLTGLLVGLAGSVLALNLSSFQPTSGDAFLFVIFAAVILGGIGQPYGTMLGALIIGLVTEISAVILPAALKADVAFALLILMLLIRPQGLIPAKVVNR